MPFKIVESHEKNSKYLEVVPSQWEQNGTIYWPKENFAKLAQNERSQPCPGWITTKGVVKRIIDGSYETALDILKIMQNQSDTDNEDIDQSATRKVLMKKGAKTVNATSSNPNLTKFVTQNVQVQPKAVYVRARFSYYFHDLLNSLSSGSDAIPGEHKWP